MTYIKTTVFSLFHIIFTINISAQVCQKVNIDDNAVKQKILYSFIDRCNKNGSFIDEKGVVQLNIYKNKEGKDCWLLMPLIEDSYKDNPPEKYAEVGVDIVLIYEANNIGRELPTDENKRTKLNDCLEKVIGDYLYIRPTQKRRTFEYIDAAGKVRKTQKRIIKGGNGGSLIIVFNADGTYVTISPV